MPRCLRIGEGVFHQVSGQASSTVFIADMGGIEIPFAIFTVWEISRSADEMVSIKEFITVFVGDVSKREIFRQ